MDPRKAEVLQRSERDYGRVVGLLENPPPPDEKLRAVIKALPDTSKRCWLGVTSPSRKQSGEGLLRVLGGG